MTTPNICFICLDATTATDSLVLHNHSECCHRQCLTEWTRTNETCPLCRLKISKHAAVEITAADKIVIKKYIEALGAMRTRENEIQAALDAALKHHYNDPTNMIILSLKSSYFTQTNSLYESHERTYDVLEERLRELRNDERADLEEYRRVYEARMTESVVV